MEDRGSLYLNFGGDFLNSGRASAISAFSDTGSDNCSAVNFLTFACQH